jgi:tripartite-type tricarboxylate transporter receptor subunit TctC
VELRRRTLLHLAASAAALPAVSRLAWAQAYPSRPVRLIVPFPPGGVYDAIGRPWAERMKSLLGTTVVENIGGGGSSLGAAAVARARPDGYTILLGGTVPHVNEALLKSRPLYDPVKDLEPIASIARTCNTIVIHPSVPAKTLKELIAYAHSNSAKLSYGHAGIGSTGHLSGELFKSLAGLPDIVQVPYRGAGPVLTDLISGQVLMGVVGLTGQVIEFHRAAKLRLLAVLSPMRVTAAPEIPTVVEAGLEELATQGSVGLLTPTGTAKTIVEQIAQATRTALADRKYQEFLIGAGFEPTPDTNPEKFRLLLEADVTRWRPVVDVLALKLD